MEPIEVPCAPTSEQLRADLGNGIFFLLATLGVALLYISLAVYIVADHSRFMQDAQPDTGVVQSIESKTRTGRRGRKIVDYYATVIGSHGPVSISVDDPIPVGSKLNYLYSPAMKSARTADNKLLSMGLVSLIPLGIIGASGWRSYEFLRSWYRFANGHYVVVGWEAWAKNAS